MGDPKKKAPAGKSKKPATDDERVSWKILRVKRRIKAGYYDRPEVREDILDLLLEAFMNGKR
ncbi:MAG: hypothetical protein HKN20_05815 [Gemmatimonadetes bacterium]|nr:hypothetical protein [Gemmatimonadota bacterium]